MTDMRLVKLEERVAHLERQGEDLSDLVSVQAAEIVRLQKKVLLLMEREAEREADVMGSVAVADQRPPHW